MDVARENFGTLPGGEEVSLYTLKNKAGGEVKIMDYGAIVIGLTSPDRNGAFADVVLGFDTLEEYVDHNPCFGAIIGRYANRIARGRFSLNGVACELACNNGKNHLHGGNKGFDKVLWEAEPFGVEDGTGIVFSYKSEDGEEGYPGALSVKVKYLWTDENELKIDYLATAEGDTFVNLSHHSYFNLKGAGNGDILAHKAKIDADFFTPTDDGNIPTGEIRPVAGSAMDFREIMEIGSRIDADEEQLRFGLGYDHNYVLNKKEEGALTLAARVEDPESRRVLEVSTTEPGLQFYTGNCLPGTWPGKNGAIYKSRHGFCLEAQHFPDSPNKPHFPSTLLRAGAEYRQSTIYHFFTA